MNGWVGGWLVAWTNELKDQAEALWGTLKEHRPHKGGCTCWRCVGRHVGTQRHPEKQLVHVCEYM